jgi:ABC-type uncharacterized transport system ATPase subunit
MQNKDVVLEVTGVTKRFPGVLANDNVNLTLHKGEILALLGENGAGKSTLMNIIYGLYHADSGSVKLRGQEVSFVSSREAIHSGIGMVHQHFQLVPVMTVAENVVLGEEITNGALLDMEEAARRVGEFSEQYGLEVEPNALIEELPVGTQQRVEIVKALYRDAEILILDEPTAVLTPQEVKDLFKVMRDLAARGVSIIFITHKLKEVLEVSHRIVVMRGGAVVGTTTPDESTPESLAAMMVGREVLLRVEKGPAKPQDVVLNVDGLQAYDDRDHLALNNVSFDVRAGEVLGVAGVQGNGQTELVEVITGLRHASGGRVEINGENLTNATPRAVTSSGTGHVPENRHRFGMVDAYSVAENLVLNNYFEQPYAAAPTTRSLPLVGALYGAITLAFFAVMALIWQSVWGAAIWPLILNLFGIENVEEASRNELATPTLISLIVMVVLVFVFGYIAHRLTQLVMRRLRPQLDPLFKGLAGTGGVVFSQDEVESHASELVERFDIRTPSVDTNGGSLSGGNQQKMVVAREFGRKPQLLIAAQPTRGIDVGSIEFIHQQIVAQRDAGAAVLLVSAELDEITALSDRIVVMYKGEVVATVKADAVTREQLGLLMAGASQQDVLQGQAAVPA